MKREYPGTLTKIHWFIKKFFVSFFTLVIFVPFVVKLLVVNF